MQEVEYTNNQKNMESSSMETPQMLKTSKNQKVRKTPDSAEDNRDKMSISENKAAKVKKVRSSTNSIAMFKPYYKFKIQ